MWMGNIGRYIGYDNVSYPPHKNQLIGCLDSFYYNGKYIKFNQQSKYFSSFCPKPINEIICQEDKCINKSRDIFDCSIPVANNQFCETSKKLFTRNNKIYILKSFNRKFN